MTHNNIVCTSNNENENDIYDKKTIDESTSDNLNSTDIEQKENYLYREAELKGDYLNIVYDIKSEELRKLHRQLQAL